MRKTNQHNSDTVRECTPDAYIEQIRSFHLPRYDEIPSIELYMDQVLTFIDDSLTLIANPDEKILTSSMVNNYVKQKIIPLPSNKRYRKEHVASLIAVCLLKKVFSISSIHSLLVLSSNSYDPEDAYNFFCRTVEESLRKLFCGEVFCNEINSCHVKNSSEIGFSLDFKNANQLSSEQRLALSSATSVANKIYVDKCFELGIFSDLALEL